MNDPAAEEPFSVTLQRRADERREQEAHAALTAAAEQLREKDAAMEGLQAENKELETVRKHLAAIYEADRTLHWRLVDLFTPGMRGVSPLHYVEKEIKEQQAENTALRKQLSDQAHELGTWKGKAEGWQQRAEIAEREVGRLSERLAAAERLINSYHGFIEQRDYMADRRTVLMNHPDGWRVSTGLRSQESHESLRDYVGNVIVFNDWYAAYQAAVAANWLPAEQQQKGEKR